MSFFRTREERQLFRVPVADHERFQIAPVPGFLLRAQDVLDGGCPTVACCGLGECPISHCEQHDLQSGKHEYKVEKNFLVHTNPSRLCLAERISLAQFDGSELPRGFRTKTDDCSKLGPAFFAGGSL